MVTRTSRSIGRMPLVLPFLSVITLALLVLVVTADDGQAATNLVVDTDDIVPDVPQPTRGTTTYVVVTVGNDGADNATSFYVKLRDVTASVDLGKLGPYNLTGQSDMDVTFTWDLSSATGGKHTLRANVDPDDDLTESDETDNTADKDVTVNLPPTAAAAGSPTYTQTLSTVAFNASGSTDTDGTIMEYLWYFGDGAMAKGLNVTHSYDDGSPSPGMLYNITLLVTDEDGGLGTKTITVRILNRAPEASVTGATINTMTPYSLSGDKSTDQDGKVTRFQWTLHNGTILWGSPVVIIYPDDGSFVVTLHVWDDDGAVGSTSIVMRVLNQAPVVRFVANRTLISAGDSVHFDASASVDLDGSITSFTWIYGDQTTGNGRVVDHAFALNGSYNVTLAAVDDDGAISYSSVRVIVGNSAPIAVARADLGYVLTFENVTFNGTSSIDVDDNIAAYSWDFGDGRSATGPVVVHRYSDDGTYTVTLTITDTGGAFGTATLSVLVGNRGPVAAFEDLVVLTGEPAHFNGTMCYDLDGYIDSFRWDVGEGNIYTDAEASNIWMAPGVFVVTLTVWDDDGASNETSFNVTVQNQAPVAHISANPLLTTRAKPVTFNGSQSYDPDGQVTNWTWNLGDGNRDFGEVVQYAYTAYGTYLATLTVRDEHGGINTTSVLITVRNQPPVALFNVTPSSALTGEELSFDASNSSDPENQIAQYYWSFGDGDSRNGVVVTHSYADDGRYTVRLTVVDQDGAASYVEFVVSIFNRGPTAVAEAIPGMVLTFEDVRFKGTGSSDVDGNVLWHFWEFGDGAVGYGPTVTHSYSNDGTYTVALTVTDDDGSESMSTVQVTVDNRAPISVAGTNMSTRTGVPVRLDGRESHDMDGHIALFTWDFGDGTSASGPVVTHSFASSQAFMVWLTVTDDDGATARSNLTVSVANVEPVARVVGDTMVMSGEAVDLDARSSYDLDGSISDHQWDMGDGKTKVGPVIQYTYTDVGTYIVTLTVTDNGLPPLKASISFKVEVVNRRPTAVATTSASKLQTGGTLELDASGSSDKDGTVVGFTWIFGDGSVGYGRTTTHPYADNGIYMVVLTVTDDNGGTDSTSLFIQVENRAPLPAFVAVTETLTLTHLEFTAEGTLDPDGEVVGFFWDFGDGSAAEGWNVSHSYLSSGIYTIRLTVMDDDSKVATVSTVITVLNRAPVAIAEAPKEAYINSTVKFDGTGSYDLDGIMHSWNWDFGDGETGEGREAYHRYLLDSEFEWHLTVIDDIGDSHEFGANITINPRPFVPPPDDGNGDGDGEKTPGPGAISAIVAVTLATLALVRSRRRQMQA